MIKEGIAHCDGCDAQIANGKGVPRNGQLLCPSCLVAYEKALQPAWPSAGNFIAYSTGVLFAIISAVAILLSLDRSNAMVNCGIWSGVFVLSVILKQLAR